MDPHLTHKLRSAYQDWEGLVLCSDFFVKKKKKERKRCTPLLLKILQLCVCFFRITFVLILLSYIDLYTATILLSDSSEFPKVATLISIKYLLVISMLIQPLRS